MRTVVRGRVKSFLIERILKRWKLADLDILAIWEFRDRLAFKVTPRFITDDEGMMGRPSMITGGK